MHAAVIRALYQIFETALLGPHRGNLNRRKDNDEDNQGNVPATNVRLNQFFAV